MTSWLDDLDAAAAHAMLGDAVAPYGGQRSVSVRPERIRVLVACVRASLGARMMNTDEAIAALDAAFAALNGDAMVIADLCAKLAKVDHDAAEAADRIAALRAERDEARAAIGAHNWRHRAEQAEAERDALLEALAVICIKMRSNEWGTETPRKIILNWVHDTASAAMYGREPKP